jgi:hypothetical protein
MSADSISIDTLKLEPQQVLDELDKRHLILDRRPLPTYPASSCRARKHQIPLTSLSRGPAHRLQGKDYLKALRAKEETYRFARVCIVIRTEDTKPWSKLSRLLLGLNSGADLLVLKP